MKVDVNYRTQYLLSVLEKAPCRNIYMLAKFYFIREFLDQRFYCKT